jgi:hypothetical protein
MENHESGRIATLADRAGKGADAAQLTDWILATWQEIAAVLSPIIGQGGVAALYRRSLHLAGQAYPWLAVMEEGVQTSINLAALKSALSQQTSADAAAGGGALLQTFHDLLATLVGPSLTEQLLRSVWATSPPGVGKDNSR